jgi:hypothetical protein
LRYLQLTSTDKLKKQRGANLANPPVLRKPYARAAVSTGTEGDTHAASVEISETPRRAIERLEKLGRRLVRPRIRLMTVLVTVFAPLDHRL